MVNLAEYFHRRRYDVILVTQYRLEEEYPISPEIRRVCSEPDESALQGAGSETSVSASGRCARSGTPTSRM